MLESGRSCSRRIFWDYPGVRSTGGRLPEQAHWPRIVVHFRLWYNSVSGFGDLEANIQRILAPGFRTRLDLVTPHVTSVIAAERFLRLAKIRSSPGGLLTLVAFFAHSLPFPAVAVSTLLLCTIPLDSSSYELLPHPHLSILGMS